MLYTNIILLRITNTSGREAFSQFWIAEYCFLPRKNLLTLLVTYLCLSFGFAACAHASDLPAPNSNTAKWQAIDTFENTNDAKLSPAWYVVDAQNETQPFVENPQVAVIEQQRNHQHQLINQYYLKKAAAQGVVGNRKALSYIALPTVVPLGEIFTFYTRMMVDSFPNNHSFGLSNLTPEQINKQSYNAFEPMLRVTDKTESNGIKNTGALMAIIDSPNGKAIYQDIINPLTKKPAMPLKEKTWYEVWWVVNNTSLVQGGQTYTVYMRGGEFSKQQQVFENAKFRMAREQALTHFITISNTGPIEKPYGNGGLAYDDIFMAVGTELSQPAVHNVINNTINNAIINM